MKNTTVKQNFFSPTASLMNIFVAHLTNNKPVLLIALWLSMARSTAFLWAKKIRDAGLKAFQPKKRGRPIGSGRKLEKFQEKKFKILY
jgi:hypothetical protein